MEGFTCKHCNADILLLEEASMHKCLKNKDIFMENNNVLFTYESNDNLDVNDEPLSNCQESVCTTASSSEKSAKQSAVWTDNATMALLSLYEANMHMLDHPKKKTKIWTAISDGLKDFEIEMSSDQVRWKINILQKKYKECCDNNNKSGRGKIEFKWYNQLDEILGKNKDAIAAHTVSSQIIPKKVSKSALSGQKDVVNCASKSSPSAAVISLPTSPIASSSSTDSVASILMNNKNTKAAARLPHGTSSNLANRKLDIEKQWLKFIENKEIRDTAREKKHEKSENRMTENLTLKKQMVSLKRKQIDQKRELSEKRLKDKENKHAEIIKIEKTKCKLLKKLLNQANIKNISDDSDS